MRTRALHLVLVLAVLGAGVLLRAIDLGGPPFCCDEFYDVFAAKSWLAGEGLRVPGREYGRAWLMTLSTAGAFSLFGESEAAARLPALAFGVLTLGLTYVAGRALFGRTAGLVALVLLAFSPHAIDISRFARLYSPLTFFGLLAALAAFRALEGAGAEGPQVTRRRLGWLALAAGAGLLAVHFHPVAIGLALAVQAYAAVLGLGLALRGRPRMAAPYAVIALGLLLVEALAAASPEVRGRLVRVALTPLPWYQPSPGDEWINHRHLAGQYGWLWYLLGPATVLVALARPRAGLFAALAFWLPFVLISGAVATRHHRYTVHLLPFAWLLLGGAVEVLCARVRESVEARLARWRADSRAWLAVARVLPAVVLLLGAAALARVTPSLGTALRRPWETTGSFTTGGFLDWRGLAKAIGAQLEPDARVISTTWHAPIYYLGRPTNHLLPAFRRRGEGDWETPLRDATLQVQRAEDFTRLRATGVPLWVIVRRGSWQRPGYLDAGFKHVVENRCRAVRVPQSLGFVVFSCDAAT